MANMNCTHWLPSLPAHTAINPYYYAPSTYANILPYAAIPTVAIKAEEKKME